MGRTAAGHRYRWHGTGCLFVGRGGECARLGQLLASSTVVLVHGPAGIGKTEIAVRVIDGHARAGDLPPGAYVSVAGAGGAVDLLERTAWALRRRRPPIRGSSPPSALAEMLERSPACLVWDDIDDVTVELLQPFVRGFAGPPCGSRLVLVGRHPPLPDLAALELGPLPPDEAAALAGKLLEQHGLDHRPELVLPASGNPQLLHLAAAELQAGRPPVVSDDPYAALRRVVGRLAAGASRRVLEILAVSEHAIEVGALQDACGPFVEPVLGGLARHMLLLEDGSSVALTTSGREVAREMLGGEVTVQTWSVLVRIFERALAGSPGDADALVALVRALCRLGRRGEALRLLEINVAARASAPLGALEQAARDIAAAPDEAPAALLILAREQLRWGEYDSARAVLDEAEPIVRDPGLARRLLVLRAQAHVRAGDPMLARQDLERARDAPGGSVSPSVTIGLAELAILRGDHRAARQALVQLVPVVRDNPRLAGRCAMAFGTSYLFEQRFDLASAWARRARLAYRRALAPPETMVGVIEVLAMVGLDRVDAAAARYAREVEPPGRVEHVTRGIAVLYPLAVLWRRGDFARCVELTLPALEKLDHHADRLARAVVASYLVRAAVALGRLDLAGELVRIVRAAAGERGLAGLALLAESSAAALAEASGDLAEAHRAAARAASTARSPSARLDAWALGGDGAGEPPSHATGPPDALGALAALRTAERCLRRADPSGALVPAAAAERWYRQRGIRYELCRSLLARGEAHAHLDESEAALEVLAECDDLASAAGYRPVSTPVALVRAAIADRAGDLEAYVRELWAAGRAAGKDLADESLARALARVGLDAWWQPRPEPRPFAAIVARLGLDRPASALVTIGSRAHLAGPSDPIRGAALIVDLERGRIVVGGRSRDLGRHELLSRLLEHLVSAGASGLTAEDLFLRVWGGREYHALRRRSSIYMALTRLRRLLDSSARPAAAGTVIEQVGGRYRLDSTLAVAIRRPALADGVPGGRRDRLHALGGSASCDAAEYARRFGMSAAHARWELALLSVEQSTPGGEAAR